MKVLPIRKGVSKTLHKRLTGSSSQEINSVAAILIGQLAKNYSHGYNELITGKQLLWLALRKVQEIHQNVAGKVVFLECANSARLSEFYESCGFKAYDVNPDGLLQFIRYAKEIELF